jgi:hypothetical protein
MRIIEVNPSMAADFIAAEALSLTQDALQRENVKRATRSRDPSIGATLVVSTKSLTPDRQA